MEPEPGAPVVEDDAGGPNPKLGLGGCEEKGRPDGDADKTRRGEAERRPVPAGVGGGWGRKVPMGENAEGEAGGGTEIGIDTERERPSRMDHAALPGETRPLKTRWLVDEVGVGDLGGSADDGGGCACPAP